MECLTSCLEHSAKQVGITFVSRFAALVYSNHFSSYLKLNKKLIYCVLSDPEVFSLLLARRVSAVFWLLVYVIVYLWGAFEILETFLCHSWGCNAWDGLKLLLATRRVTTKKAYEHPTVYSPLQKESFSWKYQYCRNWEILIYTHQHHLNVLGCTVGHIPRLIVCTRMPRVLGLMWKEQCVQTEALSKFQGDVMLGEAGAGLWWDALHLGDLTISVQTLTSPPPPPHILLRSLLGPRETLQQMGFHLVTDFAARSDYRATAPAPETCS